MKSIIYKNNSLRYYRIIKHFILFIITQKDKYYWECIHYYYMKKFIKWQ